MSNITTTTVKTVRNKARKNKRRAPKRRVVTTKKIPFAYATKQRKPYYRIAKSRKNAQEVEIEGEDLIIPAPEVQTQGPTTSDFFLTMPANPLYWIGTRLAGLAAVYQQYRPLRFDVEYIPQVPVTTPGQVICGTLWNTSISESNLQQTLMSSNGGCMTQCYQRVHSHVICDKKTLPFDLYNMRDDMANNSTNPFTWCAHYTGSTLNNNTNQPGWIYVKWRYRLSVGLGSTTTATDVYNETTTTDIETARMRMDLPNGIFPGWGITFDLVKALVKPILRKTAIFILKKVIAKLEEPGTNGSNKEYAINPGNTLTFDGYQGDFARCKDTDGRTYLVPTSTRIVMYTTGNSVEPTPEPEAYLQVGQDITIDGSEVTRVQKISDIAYQIYGGDDYATMRFTKEDTLVINYGNNAINFWIDFELVVNDELVNSSLLHLSLASSGSNMTFENVNTKQIRNYLDNFSNTKDEEEEVAQIESEPTPPQGHWIYTMQNDRNIRIVDNNELIDFPFKKRHIRNCKTPPL